MYLFSDLKKCLAYPFLNAKQFALPFLVTLTTSYLLVNVCFITLGEFLLTINTYIDEAAFPPILKSALRDFANFIILTIPYLLIQSCLFLSIIRNMIIKEPIPKFIISRGNIGFLGRTALTLLSVQGIIAILLILSRTVFHLFGYETGYGAVTSLYSIVNTLYNGLSLNVKGMLSYGSYYEHNLMEILSDIFPSTIGLSLRIMITGLLGTAIVTAALGKSGSLRQAYHRTKNKWMEIALFLLLIEVCFLPIYTMVGVLNYWLANIFLVPAIQEMSAIHQTNLSWTVTLLITIPNLLAEGIRLIKQSYFMVALCQIYTSLGNQKR